jgi:hypothetical protein
MGSHQNWVIVGWRVDEKKSFPARKLYSLDRGCLRLLDGRARTVASGATRFGRRSGRRGPGACMGATGGAAQVWNFLGSAERLRLFSSAASVCAAGYKRSSVCHRGAAPYNYSDMTGFNERVVNPGLKPLKGYWIAIKDGGNAGQLWNKVSWSAALTNGCSIEVFVRGADQRTGLGSATFVEVTNGVSFPSIRGRFVEVRLGMIRDDSSKQPVLYDLTLSGTSSGFEGDAFLDDAPAYERDDATFTANLVGVSPTTFRWFRMYPWETNRVEVAGETNVTFAVSNVDSWVNGTVASCIVSNGNGEVLELGPAFLDVYRAFVTIPASGSAGAASSYPLSINVFGQPTNLNSVVVGLWGLTSTRSADLNLLLLSPSGRRVILMSNVGGTNSVSNADIAYRQSGSFPVQADPILPSGQFFVILKPSNYGQKTPETPFGLPAGPYSSSLLDLQGDDPNGIWKLYIYDDVHPGGTGQLTGSWQLDFDFQ